MFSSMHPAQPASSAMTEWSMTRSHGTCGLIFFGSPPSSAQASRITAKSTNTGTPVKSWNSTRAGENSTSSPVWPAKPAPTMRAAMADASSGVRPQRSAFSNNTVSENGNLPAPSMADTG